MQGSLEKELTESISDEMLQKTITVICFAGLSEQTSWSPPWKNVWKVRLPAATLPPGERQSAASTRLPKRAADCRIIKGRTLLQGTLVSFVSKPLKLGYERAQKFAGPRRSWIDVRHSFWGAYNHSAGSMDRDFGALGYLLEALLVASRCPRGLQSFKI